MKSKRSKRVKYNGRFITVTTKDGLLYADNRLIALPEADWVAQAADFMFAERMVKYLEG